MKDDMSVDKLAQMVQRGFDEVKGEIKEVRDELAATESRIRADVSSGFNEVNRHIEKAIESRLDDHVHRIKKLEEEVFPR